MASIRNLGRQYEGISGDNNSKIKYSEYEYTQPTSLFLVNAMMHHQNKFYVKKLQTALDQRPKQPVHEESGGARIPALYEAAHGAISKGLGYVAEPGHG